VAKQTAIATERNSLKRRERERERKLGERHDKKQVHSEYPSSDVRHLEQVLNYSLSEFFLSVNAWVHASAKQFRQVASYLLYFCSQGNVRRSGLLNFCLDQLCRRFSFLFNLYCRRFRSCRIICGSRSRTRRFGLLLEATTCTVYAGVKGCQMTTDNKKQL
jgi:hypothetical protein